MYDTSTIFEYYHKSTYFFRVFHNTLIYRNRQELLLKKRRSKPPLSELLLAEGLTIGALVNSGVSFVSTHQNPLQRAVVGILTMVSALGNGTLDALVCMAAHSQFLLFSDSAIVFPIA